MVTAPIVSAAGQDLVTAVTTVLATVGNIMKGRRGAQTYAAGEAPLVVS